MVPIKLTLRNFMCYRDKVPPLNLEGIHVACLCGDNGHGKSALLDAMTWALWGEARAKSDDDLINLGQSEMEVEFEFSVGQNRYRVIRKRTKSSLKRTGQSLIDLQVATAEGFVPINGDTLRETQRKIIEILRMDYQTFINSALLLQGRANEFSIKTPAQRKEVLGYILGLSFYDELEKRAKDCSREKEIAYQKLASEIMRAEQELEQKPDYEVKLQSIQKTLDSISNEVKRQESHLSSLQQSKKALELKEEQLRDIERQIDNANKQIQVLDGRIKELLLRIQRYENILSSYQQNSTNVKKLLQELSIKEQNLVEKRENEKRLSGQLDILNSTNTRLESEGKEIKGKLQLLEKGEAECPLCGSKLGAEERNRIIANYESQIRDKRDEYRANSERIQTKEAELKALGQEIKRVETSIAVERTRLERQTGDLERQRSEAEELLPKEKEALDGIQKDIENWRDIAEKSTEKREKLFAEFSTLSNLTDELKRVENAYRQLQEQERELREDSGKIQESLHRCTQLEAEKEEKTKELRQTAEERSIYDELTIAFGKKGVQALIIEKALPEIEEEANRLLGKMTDNRMSFKIESQRDTKKGDTIETLDIKIADELGTRGYEMFSGGEAFRVNFALRIALSRLLARRAGAPLPTLIIDEGFGTQDNTGREKLVEAINSIQEDFEKILVITHIEELKDAFPVRIDVLKTEEGSTFSIN